MKINNRFLVLIAILVASFAFSQNEKPHTAAALEFSSNEIIIGKGINLLKSKQIDASSFHYNSVFNESKITNYRHVLSTTATRDNFTSGFNYNEYVSNSSLKINKMYGISASLSEDLARYEANNNSSVSFGMNSSYIGNEYNYTRTTTYVNESSYIDYYTNPTQLSNYVVAKFALQITELNNSFSTAKVEDIFNNFGTHILMKAEFGGNLNLNYKFSSTKYVIGQNSSFSTKINSLFGVSEKYVKLTEVNENEIFGNLSQFNSKGQNYENFNAEAAGGNPFIVSNLDLNTTISNWINSVKPSNNALLVNNNLVLVPIWKFTTNSVSSQIESYFNSKYKFEVEQSIPDRVDYQNDMTEQFYFGGGSNVKEKMYKVPSPKVMRDLGYNKVNISFAVDVHRKNIACPSECYLSLYYVDGTHTSQRLVLGTFNANKTSYMPFETKTGDISINNLEISFGNNISDYFKIRYDAKGTSESHDIVFKNLIIKYMK